MRPARFFLRRNQLDLPVHFRVAQISRHFAFALRYAIVKFLVGFPHSTHPRGGSSLSMQRVQHFSSNGKIDDFVLGVECVDDRAQACLTLLGMPLSCENCC